MFPRDAGGRSTERGCLPGVWPRPGETGPTAEAIQAYERSLTLTLAGRRSVLDTLILTSPAEGFVSDPLHAQVHARLGDLYTANGETSTAINAYRMGIAMGEETPALRFRLAGLYLRRREWVSAPARSSRRCAACRPSRHARPEAPPPAEPPDRRRMAGHHPALFTQSPTLRSGAEAGGHARTGELSTPTAAGKHAHGDQSNITRAGRTAAPSGHALCAPGADLSPAQIGHPANRQIPHASNAPRMLPAYTMGRC